VVMDGGRIVAQGTPRELIAAHATREVLELRFTDQDTAVEKLRSSALSGSGSDALGVLASAKDRLRLRSPGRRVEVLPDRLVVYADDGEAALAAVHALGLSPLTALVRRSTLEDVFLKLTGRSLVD
jgi:lipooligosaccharide transport system ATP-binding protein